MVTSGGDNGYRKKLLMVVVSDGGEGLHEKGFFSEVITPPLCSWKTPQTSCTCTAVHSVDETIQHGRHPQMLLCSTEAVRSYCRVETKPFKFPAASYVNMDPLPQFGRSPIAEGSGLGS